MRKILLGLGLAAGLIASGIAAPSSAQAAPISGAALSGAVDTTSLSDKVAYICRTVRRCGPYGCGVRRVCGWRPGYAYYGGGPYAYYGGYGPRRWHRHGYYRW